MHHGRGSCACVVTFHLCKLQRRSSLQYRVQTPRKLQLDQFQQRFCKGVGAVLRWSTRPKQIVNQSTSGQGLCRQKVEVAVAMPTSTRSAAVKDTFSSTKPPAWTLPAGGAPCIRRRAVANHAAARASNFGRATSPARAAAFASRNGGARVPLSDVHGGGWRWTTLRTTAVISARKRNGCSNAYIMSFRLVGPFYG
jgi:hypothetical protein